MFEDFRRIEAAVTAYFNDSKVAAGGARSEVRTAEAQPEALPAVWCEINESPLTMLEALLIHAIRAGETWAALCINVVHNSQESAPLHFEEELDGDLEHERVAEALVVRSRGILL